MSRRRSDHVRTDGPVEQEPTGSTGRMVLTLVPVITPLSESQNEFTRLEQFAKLQKAPVIKFKDLRGGCRFDHQIQHASHEGAG